MAKNSRAKAQRETAARVREYRAGRGYKSGIPSSVKSGARTAYQKELDRLSAIPAEQRSRAENNRLAQAASWGAHGHKAYGKYDTPENQKLWYHNKK
jgi:hypothetical protein